MKTHLSILFICMLSISFAQEKFYTCINEKGERMFSIKAKFTYAFSEGMAEVSQSVLSGGKSYFRSGFINEKGEIVIPCQFEDAYAFRYGVAWVKNPGESTFYLINKKGERVGNLSYKKVGSFSDGMCPVYDDEGKMGFVNRLGVEVIPCIYLGDGFSEGLACVTPYNDEKSYYGFIDTTGKVVIPFQYNQAGTSSFENGECRVQINGVTCMINPKGEVVFKPTLTKNCMGFYNGLSATYTIYSNRSGWGFYDRNNTWVIKPQYDNAESFHGGYSIVDKGGKYGVIDTTGAIVLPLIYASIFSYPSESGYFGVEMELNGAKQFLNPDGTPFAKVPVKYITDPNGHSLLPYFNPDGKAGYLNTDGTVAIEAQFERATAFSEGKAWIQGVTGLPIASGFSEKNFAKDFAVGDQVKCKKEGSRDYSSATVEKITENYYLIRYESGEQVWVVYNQLQPL
jgi:hypothetical protein